MTLLIGALLFLAILAFAELRRNRIETKLRESENRFHKMADRAPVLIWISGVDKLYNRFNQVWLDFSGRTMKHEVGNGGAEGVDPDDFQRCQVSWVNAFDARQPFTMEYRLRRFDGEYRWLVGNGVLDGFSSAFSLQHQAMNKKCPPCTKTFPLRSHAAAHDHAGDTPAGLEQMALMLERFKQTC